MAAGGMAACAIVGGGAIKCWGDNQYGQLGNGSAALRSTTAVSIASTANHTAVVGGSHHFCALVQGGSVECWGYQGWGAVGGGGGFASVVATPLTLSSVTGATAIGASDGHSCAVVAAGHVKCWGENQSGQIGNGQTGTTEHTPVDVLAVSGATQLALGGQHTCALLNNGTVTCWGANDNSQLGNGTQTSSGTGFAAIVPGLANVTAIAAGDSHTCALLSSGTLKCWGFNYDGQLGVSNTTFTGTTPTAVPNVSGVIAISAGGHETCALFAGGVAKCWGRNASGQLGNGTLISSFTPVAVSNLSGTTAISVGWVATCAKRAAGTVACWGANGDGQLGNGKTQDSHVPVTVLGVP